jgi:hypothetical protein
MKIVLLIIAVASMLIGITPKAEAYKYISGYTRQDGTYVSGHWRDTSNNGNTWDNANKIGMND